ncbi:uncharacterized protein LOC116170658 [Photinus pyralis]|nr:uncharacterized protein LOC116170658 [Photinus pyralis]
MWKTLLLLLVVTRLSEFLQFAPQDISKELQKWREQIVKISNTPPSNRTETLNKHLDGCLKTFCDTIKGIGLDPILLPRYNSTFINNTVYGVIELTEAKLRGLSSLVRNEYVIVKFGYPLIKIHVPLRFNKISYEANYYAELLGYSTESLLVAEVNSFSFCFDVIINVRTVSILREQFKISTLGKVALSLGGRVSGIIADILLSVIQPAIEPMIRSAICQEINNMLDFVVDLIGFAEANPDISKMNVHEMRAKDIVDSVRSGDVAQQVQVASKFLDQKIDLIRNGINTVHLDPLFIHPKANPDARVKLSNSVLMGLTSLARMSDVIIQYQRPTLRIGIPVGFKNLSFNTDYEFMMLGTVSAGNMDAYVRGCIFQLDLQINTAFVRLKVDNFRILSLGQLSVWLGGSAVGITTSFLVKTLQPFWEPVVYLTVEQVVFDQLQQAVVSFNNVTCVILDNCHVQVRDVY